MRKELLAVVHFVKSFRHYLVGKRFILRTDHASLRWLKSFKHPEGQVARWLEVLKNYDFELVHRPGRLHMNADALSRGPCQQCRGDHEGEGRKKRQSSGPNKAQAARIKTRSQSKTQKSAETWFTNGELTVEGMQTAQNSDPVLSQVGEWIHKGERPPFEEISGEGRETKFYWGQFQSLKEHNGILV